MPNAPQPPGPPAPAESMPVRAAEFAEACKSRGIALDFLPRTLPLVDKTMKASPAMADANGITAYLGEVILRETGGRWYDFEQRPMLAIGDYTTDPLTIVMGLLAGQKPLEGDVRIETTKAYCELICRMQRLWLDGTLIGAYESMSDLRTSMTPDAKLAGWLVGQGQGAVKTAKMTWDESLDFTAGSLDALERILSALHTRYKNEASDFMAAAESQMWGAYLGEVIRRQYGGQWSLAADGTHQLALSGWTSYPMSKVRQRIVDGPMDNVRVYFGAIPKAMQS